MKQEKLTELLREMSLEEKIYQLVQLPGGFYIDDAANSGTALDREVSERELYLMGSTLNIYGAEKTNAIQKKALQKQPHHIPMLFMMDVIHGYRTIFPIPLGQGAMFDPEMAREAAGIAAAEAAASGIHVAFSPMLDLVRDARWGRVMESPGEDPYLNGLVGRAIVEGFQGEAAEGYKDHVAACIKHFAGYGASTAGRDYTAAELSEHSLREYYLRAYQEAVRAGAEMVMTSFNTIGGKPSSGNAHLLREILRDDWGFKGTVISDWNAVREMTIMGFAADEKEAAEKALASGVDIEMSSLTYADYLMKLVGEGKISEKLINEAALRVLELKNRLGLFENPYKDADEELEEERLLTKESRDAARKAVRESLVLLKNDPAGEEGEKVLPIRPGERVAMIGPYAVTGELESHWAPTGRQEDCISVREAAEDLSDDYDLRFAEGAVLLRRNDYLALRSERSIEDLRRGLTPDDPEELIQREDYSERMLTEAVRAAKKADKAVLFLGEHYTMSGEANSRGRITIPENQMALLRAVAEVQENIAVVVFAGRPLDLTEVVKYAKSVVYAWLPGVMGGLGIMDALTGKANEFGRLPMSLPCSVAQLPLSYNEYRTGRPKGLDDPGIFTSCWFDLPNRPLYPFGYGISYTEFEYGEVKISAAEGAAAATVAPNVDGTEGELEISARGCCPEDRETVLFTATCSVKNIGEVSGTAIPQLYIGDVSASLVRPVKELKGFRRIELTPGEESEVRFDITPEMLSFYGTENIMVLEPGLFRIYIGADAETENHAELLLR